MSEFGRSRQDAINRGLKVYVSDKPCLNGHLSGRRTKNSTCIQCCKERSKKYRDENREKYLECLKEWRSKNPNANKEYYDKNAQHLREKARIYAENNKDKRKQSWQYWYRNNKDNVIQKSSNRRALELGAEGHYTKGDISLIIERQNGLCAEPSCLKDITKNERHVDHIFPLSKGGSNWPHNIQVLCKSCNLKKGACLPEEWARRNGRLI